MVSNQVAHQNSPITRLSSMEWNPIIKTAHWVTAFSVLALLVSGYVMTRQLVGHFELQFQMYQWHKSIGILIIPLTCFRAIWRWKFTKKPDSPDLDQLELAIARIVHVFFYFALLAMPVLGWASASASPLQIPTLIFGILELPHILPPDEKVHQAIKFAHKITGLFLAIIIGLHLCAALKHHFYDRDDTLVNMLPSFFKSKKVS